MFTRICRESGQKLRRSPTPIRLQLFGEAEAGEGDAEVTVEIADNVQVKVLKSPLADVRAKGEPVVADKS